MPLKAKIASLHEVEAKYRDLYRAAGNGSFVLDVEPIEGLSLGKVDDFKAMAAKWRTHVEKILVAEKAAAALDAVQIDPAWRDYFLAKLTAAAQLHEEGDEIEVEIVGDDGIRRIGSRGQWLTLEGFVAELKEKRPRCFLDEKKQEPTGGSSFSWTGPNPFTTGNVTDQGRLYRVDPELYSRWKAEAQGRSGGSGSTGNPFRRGESWSLTKQGELYRTDREAYERLKAEAAA